MKRLRSLLVPELLPFTIVGMLLMFGIAFEYNSSVQAQTATSVVVYRTQHQGDYAEWPGHLYPGATYTVNFTNGSLSIKVNGVVVCVWGPGQWRNVEIVTD